MEGGLRFERIAPAVIASLGCDVVSVEPVAGSVANQDFRIELADGRRVFVKVGPPAELTAEAWAIGRAAAAGVPVPQVVAYEEGTSASPLPFLVIELLPSDEDLITGVLHAVGAAMKTAHTIEVGGYGSAKVVGDPLDPDSVSGQYGTWSEFVESILADVGQLVRVDLLTAGHSVRIRRWAETMGSSPLATAVGVLLHADLKRQHILAVDGALTGIIDWGDASVGDPAWDLARASMMDPTDYQAVADGYPGADDAEVGRFLPFYRVLWNTRALAYEHRAGGDWFVEYQRRIATDLMEQP